MRRLRPASAMTATQLDLAFAAQDEGHRQVVEASDEWAKLCVADTIRKWAAQRRPFSLNDVRSAFPEVRSGLPGAMVSAAARAWGHRQDRALRPVDARQHARPSHRRVDRGRVVTTLLLVLLSITGLAAAVLLVADRQRRRHTHMRPVRYHDDTAWRAFDAAMSKHTKETNT